MSSRIKLMASLLLSVASITACSHVDPWERGTLARPDMQFTADPLEAALMNQVHESKEASSGGSQSAGAGCGCN
tara:strand:+ start:141 stop:362 length:222 start_codon:yes stop_codon:yes gene_type:complete